MANLFPEVRPGDLITAADWTLMTGHIEKLYELISGLQTGSGTGGISIISVFPPSPIRIGTEVRMVGTQFGFSTGSVRLSLATSSETVPINAFKLGSSDTELVFNIPGLASVSSSGTPARLTVSNGVGSATRDLVVLPAQGVLSGTVDVVAMGATPDPITAGPPADFRFDVTSRANLDAVYTVTPTVQVAQNQPAWDNALQVLDDAKVPLQGRALTLAQGQQKTIYVRLTAVPAVPANAVFSIGAQVVSGGVTGNSGFQTYQVGQPTPQPDTTIALTFDNAQFQPAGAGSFVNQAGNPLRLNLQPNAQALIRLKADFSVIGNYNLVATVPGGAVDWTAQVFAQSTVNPIPIAAGDLATNGHAVRNPEFLVSTGANPSNQSLLTLSITRQGATRSRALQIQLQRV